MKKYITKPIDFTGCHPVIAEALERGEMIKCKVRDDRYLNEEVRYVVSYLSKRYVSEGVVGWDHAEPIPLKVKRIMSPERAIPTLIAGGWVFSTDGRLVGPEQTIIQAMFHCMGKSVDDPSVSPWSWPPCIIEEVEDDE